MKKSSKRHLIIGNCIAAVSAAEVLRKLNPEDSITIVGEEDVPSYSRCLITYFLGDMVTDKHLLSYTAKWYAERKIDLRLSTRALAVDPKKRIVYAQGKGGKQKFAYDTLLLATGASPIFLKSFPSDPEGVVGMRNYGDAIRLKRWAKKGSKAIVIGAGFVGLKTAYGLVRKGVRVKVVELLPTVLGRMTDLEASRRIRDRFISHELVAIELNNSVINTRKQGNKYVVTYQNGGEEAADFIVAAVGVKPNTDLIAGTDVECKWTIKVNERQQTTAEDVYAAGDVAQSMHLLSKEWIYNAIWPVAVAQGKVAAYNMSGHHRTFEGNIPMNSVDFYEMWVTSIGNVQAETDGIESITFQTPRIYQKVLLQQGIPVAFMAVGNVDGAGLIRGAIVGEIPWQDFIKRPQSKILPIVSQLS